MPGEGVRSVIKGWAGATSTRRRMRGSGRERSMLAASMAHGPAMRGAYKVDLGMAEGAQQIQQTRGGRSETEIRRARLRTVRVPDAKQVDGIDIAVLRKKIKVVPPTEAVAHQPVDEYHGRQRGRCRSGGRQVEIAHAIRPTGKPAIPAPAENVATMATPLPRASSRCANVLYTAESKILSRLCCFCCGYAKAPRISLAPIP